MKRIALVAALGFCTIGVVGCGSSVPSEGDGRKNVEAMWDYCSKSIDVSDFKKLNGIELGQNRYKMIYSFALTFTTDVDYPEGAMVDMGKQIQVLSKYCSPEVDARSRLGYWYIGLLGKFGKDGRVKKDTKVEMSQEAVFIKTDNGWQIQW